MLPPFNADGNLPEGIHQATNDEVLARFATMTARRQWLGERLHSLLVLAKATGKLERVFLWGSFVTDKPLPNDLDVLLVVADDFSIDSAPARCEVLFDHAQARIHFHADVFWTKASVGADILALWLDTYQTGKDFSRRGIIEVVFA
jgi:predicted nucleotidyltransferase